jgi:hypothetical protein
MELRVDLRILLKWMQLINLIKMDLKAIGQEAELLATENRSNSKYNLWQRLGVHPDLKNQLQVPQWKDCINRLGYSSDPIWLYGRDSFCSGFPGTVQVLWVFKEFCPGVPQYSVGDTKRIRFSQVVITRLFRQCEYFCFPVMGGTISRRTSINQPLPVRNGRLRERCVESGLRL